MSAICRLEAQLTQGRSCQLRDLFGHGWADLSKRSAESRLYMQIFVTW